MLIGYARVSKIDKQDTRAQAKALKEAGCRRIFEEHAFGARWERPQLHRALVQCFTDFQSAITKTVAIKSP